jgi:hypothetical protein
MDRAIGDIKAKIAEIEKCPDAGKVRELKNKRKLIKVNIKTLMHLSALQSATQGEFFRQGVQKEDRIAGKPTLMGIRWDCHETGSLAA